MGDFLVLRFVFAGNPLPNNAEIKIAIDNYIKHIYFKKMGNILIRQKLYGLIVSCHFLFLLVGGLL